MSTARLVVVGNGMAGIRTLEELLRRDAKRYAITVFGAEPHPNYNRILLSPVLAGERTLDEIVLNDFGWYEAHGIELRCGQKVVSIDRSRRLVFAENHEPTPYDRLLLATGSVPIVPPLPGSGLQGVLAYRDIADTQKMIAASTQFRRAVVIGGGLLGLEAACGLVRRGMEVTVVHLAPWLMERQLDRTAAGLLQESLEARGLRFRLSAKTEAFSEGDAGQVGSVVLADGEIIPAQLVVVAIGIRPNTALAESAGLYCDRGIVVSDTLQTFDPRIYAVGECVSHRGRSYGLVAPLFEQAQVCADHLAEGGVLRYGGSILSTKLKVTGIDVFSVGDFLGDAKTEEILLADRDTAVYRKLVLRDGKLIGACLFGDTEDSPWYLDLIRQQADVDSLRDELMFGRPEPVEARPLPGTQVPLCEVL
jgi:nitrite reductase (NADH) large subunit